MSSEVSEFLKRHLWHIITIVAFALLLVAVMLPRFRYTTVHGKGDLVYIVDNFTGKTRGLRGSKMFDVNSAADCRRNSRQLSKSEIANITGKMGHSHYSWGRDVFKGSLYNGNKRICVTSVTIAVRMIYISLDEQRSYVINTSIMPLTAQEVETTIISDGDNGERLYNWWIESATGYEVDD